MKNDRNNKKNMTDIIVNEQSNNKLETENMNYLESLYSAVSISIKQLSSFNVNTSKFIQIKSLHGTEFNTSEFNETIKDTTINFLKTILGIIDSLKKNKDMLDVFT